MSETTIYFWTDRVERAYALLRQHAGHWRLEWGFRDPPRSDNYEQQGEHVTSSAPDALRRMLTAVRALGAEPDEVERVERELAEALLGARAAGPEQG